MIIENFFLLEYIINMTKEEKLLRIESLKKQAVEIKKEIEYYNAMQNALKLVLNGSYV
jgi:hypothetical protein